MSMPRRATCQERYPATVREGARAPRTPMRRGDSGQGLVEFALVLMVFMLVTVGLLDGLRVIFFYSQIQEAAREGARWGSVQVARVVSSGGSQTTPGGDFSTVGNAAGTYTNCTSTKLCDYTLTGSGASGTSAPISNTIVGAVEQATTDVDLKHATVTVDTTIPTTATEVIQTSPLLTNLPITVTVQYSFKPILSMVFGGVTIPLKGTSAMLHE